MATYLLLDTIILLVQCLDCVCEEVNGKVDDYGCDYRIAEYTNADTLYSDSPGRSCSVRD